MGRAAILGTIAASLAFFLASSVGGATVPPTGPTEDRATIVVRVVDDEGHALPARVRIERRRFTSHGRTLAVGLADEDPAVFRTAESHVRIVATHGPEWSVASRELALEPGREYPVRFVLVRHVERALWISADLHVHTNQSPDGSLAPEERLRDARAADLDRLVLSDHNRVTPSPEPGFAISGVEITTRDPAIGHFNAFPMDHAPRHRGTDAARIFAEVHRDPSALVQINHPRMEHHLSYFELGELRRDGRMLPGFSLDADLLEVFNGYDIGQPRAVLALFEEWLRLRSLGHPMIATGGSDSHGYDAPAIGWARTYVRPRTGETWIDALRRGAAFVSNGPLLDVRVGSARPGDAVPLAGRSRVELAIEVRAASYVDVRVLEIYRGPRRIERVEIDRSVRTLRYTGRVAVDVTPGDELVVRVVGERTLDDLTGRTDVEPCAFTNPIRFIPTSVTSHDARGSSPPASPRR